jgi:hypothetical protein
LNWSSTESRGGITSLKRSQDRSDTEYTKQGSLLDNAMLSYPHPEKAWVSAAKKSKNRVAK